MLELISWYDIFVCANSRLLLHAGLHGKHNLEPSSQEWYILGKLLEPFKNATEILSTQIYLQSFWSWPNTGWLQTNNKADTQEVTRSDLSEPGVSWHNWGEGERAQHSGVAGWIVHTYRMSWSKSETVDERATAVHRLCVATSLTLAPQGSTFT